MSVFNFSEDDINAWKSLIATVKPIDHETFITPIVTKNDQFIIIKDSFHEPFIVENKPPVSNIPGIEGKVSKQIRRGKLPTDGRIDLHGMTLNQAHQEVIRYLMQCYNERKRKIIVITGKSGEIRREFPMWINASSLKSIIISCTNAHQNQGGTGAFIVILKKP